MRDQIPSDLQVRSQAQSSETNRHFPNTGPSCENFAGAVCEQRVSQPFRCQTGWVLRGSDRKGRERMCEAGGGRNEGPGTSLTKE